VGILHNARVPMLITDPSVQPIGRFLRSQQVSSLNGLTEHQHGYLGMGQNLDCEHCLSPLAPPGHHIPLTKHPYHDSLHHRMLSAHRSEF